MPDFWTISSMLVSGSVLGGSSQLGYVVNGHGDHKSPKDRVVLDPFQMAELYGL